MQKKLSYRELNSDEREEITRLSKKAQKIIFADLENENILEILEKIKKFIESVKVSKLSSEKIEEYAYELGSLYGDTINKKYNWNWLYLEKDGETYYCVVPESRRVCCAPHNYFYTILNSTHDNNLKLLFNMIKTQYPKDWEFTFLT
ncbi:hypothetical protein ACYULU_02980 [Breznakiellaceae bacterium SP9]